MVPAVNIGLAMFVADKFVAGDQVKVVPRLPVACNGVVPPQMEMSGPALTIGFMRFRVNVLESEQPLASVTVKE